MRGSRELNLPNSSQPHKIKEELQEVDKIGPKFMEVKNLHPE